MAIVPLVNSTLRTAGQRSKPYIHWALRRRSWRSIANIFQQSLGARGAPSGHGAASGARGSHAVRP